MDRIINVEVDLARERQNRNGKPFWAITIPEGLVINGRDLGGWEFLVSKVAKSPNQAEGPSPLEDEVAVVLPGKWEYELKKQYKEPYGGYATIDSLKASAEDLSEAFAKFGTMRAEKVKRLDAYNLAYDKVSVAVMNDPDACMEDLEQVMKQQKAFGRTTGYRHALSGVAEVLGYDGHDKAKDMLGFEPDFDKPGIFVDLGKHTEAMEAFRVAHDGMQTEGQRQVVVLIESLWAHIERGHDSDRGMVMDGEDREYQALRGRMMALGYEGIVNEYEIPDISGLDITLETERYTFFDGHTDYPYSPKTVYDKGNDRWLSVGALADDDEMHPQNLLDSELLGIRDGTVEAVYMSEEMEESLDLHADIAWGGKGNPSVAEKQKPTKPAKPTKSR